MKLFKQGTSPILLILTNPSFQVSLAILAAILIVVFVISAYLYNSLVGVTLDVTEYPARVIEVVENTPAQDSGIQVDDRVLKIDGHAIPPWGNQPIYRAGIKAGEIITYDILRDDQPLTIAVPAGQLLSSPLEIVLNVILIFLPAGFWLIGLIMVLFSPESALPARLFGFHWIITGLSLAAAIFGRAGYFWGANTVFLVCWAMLIFSNVAVHLYFPISILPGRWQNQVVTILAILALGLSVMTVLADWLFFPRAWSQGLEAYNAFLPLGLALAWLIPIGYFVSFLAGLGLLFINHFRFRRAQPGLSQQTRLVIAGLGLAISPLLFLTFIPYLLTGTPLLNQNVGFMFFLLMPLAYAYAIFQKKLFRIDVIINRSVVLFLVVLTVLGVSSLLLLIVTQLLSIPTKFIPLVGGSVALVMALPTARLQHRLQVFVNRVMYGEHYDYLSITSDFSDQLAKTVVRETLIELLGMALPKRMGVQESALFLMEEGQFRRQGLGEPTSLPLESSFARALQRCKAPTFPQELIEVIPETLAWGQLFSPLILENQLYGLLVLGERLKGDLYNAQDVRIVTTITQQATLAYANVRLIARLRGLNRRMVRADEASRKEVAADLHDYVLQNLIYVKDRLLQDPELKEVAGYLNESIQQLRLTMKAQRPALLDQNLDLALHELTLDTQKMVGKHPVISWYADLKEPLHMEEEKKTAIYRIAQEAVTNARKHADAQSIRVKLEKTAKGEMLLFIEDDGIGMPDEARRSEKHYGLEGMYERALMIGADLHISSHPGAGTTVVLRFSL